MSDVPQYLSQAPFALTLRYLRTGQVEGLRKASIREADPVLSLSKGQPERWVGQSS